MRCSWSYKKKKVDMERQGKNQAPTLDTRQLFESHNSNLIVRCSHGSRGTCNVNSHEKRCGSLNF